MTAQELASIVGTEPKPHTPWWPKRARYVQPKSGHAGSYKWCLDHGKIDPKDAESLFIASMVTWLVSIRQKPHCDSDASLDFCVMTVDGVYYGPTLLHALHAACVAAEGSGA